MIYASKTHNFFHAGQGRGSFSAGLLCVDSPFFAAFVGQPPEKVPEKGRKALMNFTLLIRAP